uniref:Uncharacterized protein n=1 Tax=Glossina brevipalpis TaxID=37001 RepID=A0A1A9WCW8_9MUSC
MAAFLTRNDVRYDVCYLKLIPHFLLICGVCIDAIDSNSGTSFSERFNAVVTAFSEQKSVSNKKAAKVSEWKVTSNIEKKTTISGQFCIRLFIYKSQLQGKINNAV